MLNTPSFNFADFAWFYRKSSKVNSSRAQKHDYVSPVILLCFVEVRNFNHAYYHAEKSGCYVNDVTTHSQHQWNILVYLVQKFLFINYQQEYSQTVRKCLPNRFLLSCLLMRVMLGLIWIICFCDENRTHRYDREQKIEFQSNSESSVK